MELALPSRPDGGSHVAGFSVVILVHVVVGYALVSGLAQKLVDKVRAPMEARLIEEIKLTPPPPEKVKLLPKTAAPPPPFVPAPEVQVAAAPAAPSITAVTPIAPPVVQDYRPSPPPAPAPAPAPPPKAEPVSIGVACPTMVAPVLPRRAQQDGIGGLVRAQATIRDGKVVEVRILNSKPIGLFDASVRTAMLQYGCQTTGASEIVAIQTFEFKAPD